MKFMQIIWSRMPLVGRLLATASVALLVAITSMLFVSVRQEAKQIRMDLRHELARELTTLPAAIAEMVVLGDFASLEQALGRHVAREMIVSADFEEASGAHVQSHHVSALPGTPRWVGLLFDAPDISGSTAIIVGGRTYGTLTLTLTAQRLVARSWDRLASYLAVLLLTVGIAFLGIWLVLRSGLAPLKELAIGANAMAAGNLGIELVPRGSPEVRYLIDSFDRMAKRVLAAQTSIKLSEERLHLAITGANDGVWDWDMKTNSLYMSSNLRQMLGLADSALSDGAESFSKNMHPEDKRALRSFINDYLSGKVPIFNAEYRFQQKDGSIRWILSRGEALRDENGIFCRMTGSSTDITDRKQTEAALHQSEQNFRQQSRRLAEVIWGTNIGTWEWNVQTGEATFNDRWAEIVGYSLDELAPVSIDTWMRLGHPDDIKRSGELLECCFKRESDTYECEVRMRHKNGDWIWVLARGRVAEWSADGKPLRMSGTHHEINDRKHAEARLQLAASVFTHTREGIMITDIDGTIVEVNDSFTDITGYSRAEVQGSNPRLSKGSWGAPDYYDEMWQGLTTTGQWNGETWNRRKNGEVYAERITVSTVFDDAGNPQNYVALFSDITPMKKHAQELEYIAHYDSLTNLPNRVLLADRLQQAIAQSGRRDQSLALAYLDLDGFKAINDRYGHDVGDGLLIVIAQRMKAALRGGDSIARIGGDEFVSVLVDLAQPQDCELVLARLLEAASEPVIVGEHTLRVSASIGVALYPKDGADADLLMRHADQAMYLAKQAGKNRYQIFDIEQENAARSERNSIDRIGLALERREFILYYQPKVNMKTGDVVGAEALIRWQHPERGLLSPAVFLPVIDNHAISIDIGAWVIETVLEQMATWFAAGLSIPVSVNVAARQIQDWEFVSRLAELFAAHPTVAPSWLELEILETSALDDMAKVSEVMHACRKMGVRFVLDDFGTGYSSLNYLKQLPVDLLKIDQTFVRDMLDDPEDLAIIEGVLGLATAFRREVIAEGVETVAHGELLLALGCEIAQGYGIAPPMSAAALAKWVITWRPDAAWSAWSNRSRSRDDSIAVFAEVEHRFRMRIIETFLKSDGTTPPALAVHDCRVGRWQQSEGRLLHGEHSDFSKMVSLHKRMYALGTEIVALKVDGRDSEAYACMGQMHVLRDELVEGLRHIVHEGATRSQDANGVDVQNTVFAGVALCDCRSRTRQ